MKNSILFLFLLLFYACKDEPKTIPNTEYINKDIVIEKIIDTTTLLIEDTLALDLPKPIKPKPTPIPKTEFVEDIIINSMNEKENQIPTEIVNQYSTSENSTHFKRSIHNYGDPSVGCSSSHIDINLTIPTLNDSFYLTSTDLTNIIVEYKLAGGLYDETSSTLLRGFVKGVKQTDNSWLLETNIWLLIKSFPQEKDFEKNILFKEVFTL